LSSRFGNGAAFRKGREFAAWLGIVHFSFLVERAVMDPGISKVDTARDLAPDLSDWDFGDTVRRGFRGNKSFALYTNSVNRRPIQPATLPPQYPDQMICQGKADAIFG
jgi:hypothetical protein